MEVLQSWAAQNGAEWPHLQSKGRSMHAAKDLASEDMLMNIPFRLLMHINMTRSVDPFNEVFDSLAQEGASERTLLCLFVAVERAKGLKSFWWPYLRMLPQKFTTPLWLTSEEQSALQGTRVAAGLEAEQDALNELVNKWGYKFLNTARSYLSYACKLGTRPMSSEDPVASRAYYRDNEPPDDWDSSDERNGEDMFWGPRLHWEHEDDWADEGCGIQRVSGNSEQQRERDRQGDNTEDPECPDMAADDRPEYVSNMDLAWAAVTRENLLWARSVVFSRAFTLRWGEKHVIALVPLFDMLDHSPTARLTWLTDEAKGVVTFSTDAAVPSGAVVYNNYGQKPNEELLQGYGFVLPDNPAERFVVKLGIGSSRLGDDPDEEETTWRKALLERLGIVLEHKLSIKDPLPKAFLDAARLLALPERTAYACVQRLDALSETGQGCQFVEGRLGSGSKAAAVGNEGGGSALEGQRADGIASAHNEAETLGVSSEDVLPRFPYIEMRVVGTLRKLLIDARDALAGGTAEEDLELYHSLDAQSQEPVQSGAADKAASRRADGGSKRKRYVPPELCDSKGNYSQTLACLAGRGGIEEWMRYGRPEGASDEEDESEKEKGEEEGHGRGSGSGGKAVEDPFGHLPEGGSADDAVNEVDALGPFEAMRCVVLYRLGQKQIINAALAALQAMAASVIARTNPRVFTGGAYCRELNYDDWCAEHGVDEFAIEEVWPIGGPPEGEKPLFKGHTLLPTLRITEDSSPGDCLAFVPENALLTGAFPDGLRKLLKETNAEAWKEFKKKAIDAKKKAKGAGKKDRYAGKKEDKGAGKKDKVADKEEEGGAAEEAREVKRIDLGRVFLRLSRAPADMRLAVTLMWERALGAKSQHKAFVDMLAGLPETAVCWDDSHLEQLTGTSLHAIVTAHRTGLKEQYEDFLEEAASGLPSPYHEAFSEERFIWAMQITTVYSVECPLNGLGGKLVLAPILCFIPLPYVGAALQLRWGFPDETDGSDGEPEDSNEDGEPQPSDDDEEPQSAEETAAPRDLEDVRKPRGSEPQAGPSGQSTGLENPQTRDSAAGSQVQVGGQPPLPKPSNPVGSADLSEAPSPGGSTQTSGPSSPGGSSEGSLASPGVCLEAACPLKAGTLLLNPLEGLDSETRLLEFGCDPGPQLRGPSGDDVTGSGDDVTSDVMPENPLDACEVGFEVQERLQWERCKLLYALGSCTTHYLGLTVEPTRMLEAMAGPTLPGQRGGRFKAEEANAVLAAWDSWQAVGPPTRQPRGTDEAKELADEHGKRSAAARAQLDAAIQAFRTWVRTKGVRKKAAATARDLLVAVQEKMGGQDAETDKALWRAIRVRIAASEAELLSSDEGSIKRRMALTRLRVQDKIAAAYAYRYKQKWILDRWIKGLKQLKREREGEAGLGKKKARNYQLLGL